MIQKLELSASSMELDDDIKKYVHRKIGRLDKYVTRHARKSIHAEVKLRLDKGKKNDKFVAEVVLRLPHETLAAKEATLNIYAAIDIVEAKLRSQLRKYNAKATNHKSDRKGVLAHLRRLADIDFRGRQN